MKYKSEIKFHDLVTRMFITIILRRICHGQSIGKIDSIF